jgi:hypothetical protein
MKHPRIFLGNTLSLGSQQTIRHLGKTEGNNMDSLI